jgi:hypothetical protein
MSDTTVYCCVGREYAENQVRRLRAEVERLSAQQKDYDFLKAQVLLERGNAQRHADIAEQRAKTIDDLCRAKAHLRQMLNEAQAEIAAMRAGLKEIADGAPRHTADWCGRAARQRLQAKQNQ